MNDADEAWRDLIEGVIRGDDAACLDFWNQYGPLIEGVAKRQLGAGMRRRVGPESVVLSACRTFFRRAQQGEFDFADSESLWRLLCAITVNKAREKARYHLRKKRGLDAEVHGDNVPLIASAEPTPSQIAETEELLEQLLSRFSDEEQQMLQMKLQQHTHEEIASALSCSERTVRRVMKRVQGQLERMLEDE